MPHADEILKLIKDDRIELVDMPNDPCPIEPGTLGTVEAVTDLGEEQQVRVKWDNGRTLMLILPHDTVKKL